LTVRISCAVALALVVPALAASPAEAASDSVVGVWKVTEVVTTGSNAATNGSPQPSLYIFTKGHYSLMGVMGAQPRPLFPVLKTPGSATDAEKIARYEQWNLFQANSGTYEIKGTTLTRRPLVAKNQDVMIGPPNTAEIKLDGDVMWLVSKSAAGQPVSETRAKLTRLE
jgi:hypothetical protein